MKSSQGESRALALFGFPALLAPVLSLLVLPSTTEGEVCKFTSSAVEKDEGQGIKTWVYTEPYRESLFEDGLWEDDAAYKTYTSWLNKTIPRDFHGLDPFDQRACLVHQREIFKNVGYSTYNWDIILNGTVGGLYQMNCIESLLWGVQNKYHPQKVSATEFGAYILVNAQKTTVKVYLQTGPTLGVPGMDWVTTPIKEDIQKGFDVITFLHLHPFDASNTKYQDCAGTCIPSDPDLAAFASDLAQFNAKAAWITNGAVAFRFPLTQLQRFHHDVSDTTRPEIYRGEQSAEQRSPVYTTEM
eukprot:m.120842 g.120842  ORF g.120842 m.120842 type:complete len:300 (+) comp17254_c0_seq6:160-1059(+)